MSLPEGVKANPFAANTARKEENRTQAQGTSFLGRTVTKEDSHPNEITRLADLIRGLLRRLEAIEDKQKETETQLNQINNVLNNHLSQISTQNSSINTTVLSVLGQVQSDLLRNSEQTQDTDKLVKELQEKQGLILKITAQIALKKGVLSPVEDDE